MPKVIFIGHDGATHVIEGRAGQSLMESAVKNGVPGIDADCGGACACATCHVYIDPAWREAVGEPGDMESSMLGCLAEAEPASRLSCQVRLTSELDGLVVRTPRSQILV